MPRRHDNDAPDDFEDDTNAQGSRWQRRLIVWGFAAFALALGFLIPYTMYLNKQVTQRFGELRWQIPTRVYGRPLVLVPGNALDAATLKTELDAASYRDDGQAKLAGTYQQDGSRFTI
ncbi:penicillin-binding protein 1B, partial [Xanthomonas perforans]|nr:penicillin-binding protein 1B [Xanthomonas perforans]